MIRTSKPARWSEETWVWYQTEWVPDAARAAQGRPFAKHLPAAALNWGACGSTTDAAVQGMGERIWDYCDDFSWRSLREAAALCEVSVPIAMVWAADYLARRIRPGGNGKEVSR